ncbi:MAG: inositol monophosphatase [Verrucomicrobia bacterium]|nr:inositol monophosphatase [Verrucomicrobiota bacterium]
MNQYLDAALDAARAAGALIRDHFGRPLTVNSEEAHDIKLELDVRSQALITDLLLERFPEHAILGEEGSAENAATEFEWVIDPIDGTVNYYYSIPHFCISIALRKKGEIIVGAIYDPMRDELWHAESGGKAFLNNKPIEVSQSTDISQSVVSVGMSKTTAEIEVGLSIFQDLLIHARKCRMMGSAALDLAYVATGRFDAYIERSVNWWDIAAGVLLVNCAGGRLDIAPSAVQSGKLSVLAWNGKIDRNQLTSIYP